MENKFLQQTLSALKKKKFLKQIKVCLHVFGMLHEAVCGSTGSFILSQVMSLESAGLFMKIKKSVAWFHFLLEASSLRLS